MSQVQETIKQLEGLDNRLKQAIDSEEKAKTANRTATRMRSEADAKLREAYNEKQEAAKLLAEVRAENTKLEENLKRREAVLRSKQADFERASAEKSRALEKKETELNSRSALLDKREAENRAQTDRLSRLDEKYRAIEKYINDTL